MRGKFPKPVNILIHRRMTSNHHWDIFTQYKILHSCEITPKTGAGDSAVQQARTLRDSLTAATAALRVMT